MKQYRRTEYSDQVLQDYDLGGYNIIDIERTIERNIKFFFRYKTKYNNINLFAIKYFKEIFKNDKFDYLQLRK